MRLAVSFTNFGPYHLARLRALGHRLAEQGGTLIAYETAGVEQKYPWQASRGAEPFEWTTLFPDSALESIPAAECTDAMRAALDRDQPEALGIVGYVRPESLAMLDWARAAKRPTVLMSESQAIDRPRVWWKEALKGRRVRRFDAALVGGPAHRDYLVSLGLPAERIAFGYNAVDHDAYAAAARAAREHRESMSGLPARPYFLAVSRFVPEKNLERLVEAFGHYRATAPVDSAWDLVLCGAGESEASIEATIQASGVAEAVHRPGFLQASGLAGWYAHAGAFVLPSLSEPWGLVANEAAACSVPLLLSERAGCARTLVPEPVGMTGRLFDPGNRAAITECLRWIAGLDPAERQAIGRRAEANAAQWGPERFATGTMQALELAIAHRDRRAGRSARREAIGR